MQVMRGGCPCSTNATNTSHVCCENCMLRKSAASSKYMATVAKGTDLTAKREDVFHLSTSYMTGEPCERNQHLETNMQSGVPVSDASVPCEKCQQLRTNLQSGATVTDTRVLCEKCQKLETNMQSGRQQQTYSACCK